MVGLLALRAVPDALMKRPGGPSRQMGVLFATGLLITLPVAGWAVLAGIAICPIIQRSFGPGAETPTTITAAGIIADDAIYGLSNVFRGAEWGYRRPIAVCGRDKKHDRGRRRGSRR